MLHGIILLIVFFLTWEDRNKVIKINTSVSGQATVICNGNVSKVACMFYELSNLTSIDLSNFDTSKITDTSSMFYNCTNLVSINLFNFDTSNIIAMGSMFYNCTKLTTIKGVIDMKSIDTDDPFMLGGFNDMFKNCRKLKGVKIKNPPANFKSMSGLSSSQYTIVS